MPNDLLKASSTKQNTANHQVTLTLSCLLQINSVRAHSGSGVSLAGRPLLVEGPRFGA